MRVIAFTAAGFRNLRDVAVSPDRGVNVFYGDNAQGKTNLLEALWMFTGGRSFRGAKDAELIARGQESAALTMAFEAAGREQQAAITLTPRRSAVLNGVKLSGAAKLSGRFCGVVFSPAHLSLIDGGPDNRRRFVDAASCQLRPGYIGVITAYERVLRQRNSLLRNMRQAPAAGQQELLEVYDIQLAIAGARLIRMRGNYLFHISTFAKDIYAGLSRNREELGLAYRVSGDIPYDIPADRVRDRLYAAITAAREADLAAGFSTVGPHRDDFEVTVNELSAKSYGSQGQKRSAVIALKLSEAAALREVTGEQPVALLDDVMSELDEWRQDYLLNHLTDMQVFITCCDPSTVTRLAGGARFRVENGEITEQ